MSGGRLSRLWPVEGAGDNFGVRALLNSKTGDDLGLVVVEDLEVVLLEITYRATFFVTNYDWDEDNIHVALESVGGCPGPGLEGLGLRLNAAEQQNATAARRIVLGGIRGVYSRDVLPSFARPDSRGRLSPLVCGDRRSLPGLPAWTGRSATVVVTANYFYRGFSSSSFSFTSFFSGGETGFQESSG